MHYDQIVVSVNAALKGAAHSKGIGQFSHPNEVVRDSLDMVEFIVILEEELGIEINDEIILGLNTSTLELLTKDIVALLSNRD